MVSVLLTVAVPFCEPTSVLFNEKLSVAGSVSVKVNLSPLVLFVPCAFIALLSTPLSYQFTAASVVLFELETDPLTECAACPSHPQDPLASRAWAGQVVAHVLQ